MVTVDDERLDARFCKLFHAVPEVDLVSWQTIGAVIYVACNQEKIHLFIPAQFDQIVERLVRGVLKPIGNLIAGLRPQPHERASDMQVSGVYEAKWLHVRDRVAGECDGRVETGGLCGDCSNGAGKVRTPVSCVHCSAREYWRVPEVQTRKGAGARRPDPFPWIRVFQKD